MKRITMIRMAFVVAVVVGLANMGREQVAWADAAPPAQPPGAALSPGEPVTYVQMVAEEVLLTIEEREQVEEETWHNVAANQMVGYVDATFLMRNQGETKEAFDVWFPLGANDGYFNVTTVRNFTAWVDDVPAQITEAQREDGWGDLVPWATWPATFPPGQDVVLRVAYEVLPDGYAPYGTFPYILETGAGWWGNIGAGTITFRLPYDVNETNTVLNPEAYTGPQIDSLSPNPPDFTVSGRDVVWRFADLEPTQEDNIRLTVLAPGVWTEMVAAREAAAATPDDAEAQWRLARALSAALYIRYGMNPIGNSLTLAHEAEAAYLRTLELAPDNVEIYVEYLYWLEGIPEPGLPVLPENMRPMLERALQLAPDDERLLEIQAWIAQLEPYLVTPTATARATPMPRPTHTATAGVPAPTDTQRATARATPIARATATATLPATATPRPSAVPRGETGTPTPVVVAVASATASTVPTATSTQVAEPGSRGICPGALLATVVPLGLWGIQRQRRKPRP